MLPQVYADYYEDGEFVFTGFNLGGEDAYFTNFLADAPSPLVTNWLQYMVLKCVPIFWSCGCARWGLDADWGDSDTTWTIDQYDSSVFKIADAVNPGGANVRRLSLPPLPLPRIYSFLHAHWDRRSTRT